MLAAVLVQLTLVLVAPAPASASFGFQSAAAGFGVTAIAEDGSSTTLGGSHPYALTTMIAFNLQPSGSGLPDGEVRNIFLDLPPGLIENPSAVPKCSPAAFDTPRISPFESSRSGESCPDASQIGVVGIRSTAATGGIRYFGVFNLAPPPGSPSRFGFSSFGAPIVFTPHIRQAGGGYGPTLASRNISQLVDIQGIDMTIWGNPWATAHDHQRGNCLNEANFLASHGQCPIAGQTHPAWAYLTLPSDCTSSMRFSASADSWQQPGGYLPDGEPDLADPGWRHATSLSALALEGCDQLDFFSQASAVATASSVSSSTGLSFQLETSQAGLLAPGGRFAPQVRKAVVALPEGLTINPSVGAGLGACTAAQFAAETALSVPGAACPNSSKVGVVTLETPLLTGDLRGSLFIAKPFDNPFGAPYALYFVARSPERGFVVKVAGKLDADPTSGRLIATFDDLPQLPYSQLKVDFREGQRAPLVTPPTCGAYVSQIALSPWTNPGMTLTRSSSFTLTSGLTANRACPAGGAPFAPQATAGTLNANAGLPTSFYLHLTRSDVEQEITSYSTVLPPGLLGKIAGIPHCADAAIEAAKSRTGAAEARSPSCPGASEIGHTYTGFGVGPAPAYSAGRFYLAGPYHGAPLSVVAINPAIIGPFDLGTIVVRSAIQLDPMTARVTIDSSTSDPIPHIFAGIPLRLRDVRVYIDRPDFMINPTSCAPFSITSKLTGADVPFNDPRGAIVSAAVPYQLSNCGSLKFAPKLDLRLRGGAKRRDYPQLKVVVAPRTGDANILSAAVTLPPSLFLAQSHIREICTAAQAATDTCPGGSVVGRAMVETPLLVGPLEGSVYLRSSKNPLPDLMAVLHGTGGIRIVLEGLVDSYRGGLRGTFEGLPDARVRRFEMTIFGGRKRGIIVSSNNLCSSPQLAIAYLVGQNNLGEMLKPRVAVKCAKKRERHRSGAGR